MKYAVISDTHGNLPAFMAVYKDALKQGAEKLLLLGDYIEDYPTPNEMVEFIRKLNDSGNAIMVRGNKEDYLLNSDKESRKPNRSKQFAPIYWNYDELKDDNLEFLNNLPKSIDFIDAESQKEFHLSHSMTDFINIPHRDVILSSGFYREMEWKPFTHEEYLAKVDDFFKTESDFYEEIMKLPKGVYLFGHSHLQWHANIEGRILINSGSCGIPMDFEAKVPYTMVDTSNGSLNITEHRVSYDIDSAINAIRNSSLYDIAPTWFDNIISALMVGREHCSFFIRYVYDVAKTNSDNQTPVLDSNYEIAEKKWKESDFYKKIMKIQERK